MTLLANFSRKDIERIKERNFRSYKPSAKQKKFHDLGKDSIERMFLAGNRTGKTFCGCLEDAIHLMSLSGIRNPSPSGEGKV